MSIPSSELVNVSPGVISGGSGSQQLTGLILTRNTRVPIGQVLSLSSVAAVTSYFGSGSQEAGLAANYFAAFDNSAQKPGALKFFQYTGAGAVAAYLRGGNVGALGLAAIQAITAGVLVLTVNGTQYTSAAFNLSSASSFSAAATAIQSAFTSPPFTVTYDSVSGAFVFTSNTTGTASTITYATGSASATLLLTQATGAVLSQGAAAATPASAMASIIAVDTNWGGFATTWEATVSDAVAFAAWNASQNDAYAYIQWATDVTLSTTVPATASAAYAIQQAGSAGVFCIYAPINGANAAAFVLGIAASINFAQTGGRVNYAFATQSGLAPDVTSQQIAANVLANGVNYYGQYGTTNGSEFNLIYNGNVTGPFKWMDSFVNQQAFNAQMQAALLSLLTTVKNLPYNAQGYQLIRSALEPIIAQMVAFGAIQPGVTLSGTEAAQINAQAGFVISTTVQNVGWYLLVADPGPTVRAARGSPICTLFYTDGQSVQQINLSSLEVA